ncbi:MAG TPA: hypothetical protein DEG17_26085 [Cyanobacteria bacterium UBA11149]|nr:hypothetical protein [Cyanobacteria bacterium UBA11367]HBE58886.1 hypothetical protein [Cyanobacteria bacterium UBA11366]HBK65429.1 hypothetical protein [Cyanobacteria bacterium UBA11166]HBR73530.1 hypothetical protein [Cyanobacteria bacterium UBA11159]HBS69572.1 hypothetical protein [Cyanobacteria bacterium UBA11153]HBW92240.1 hypothetical protein [Cyanobacteria bacterium UBA11149]HCA93986.1 hypothetical protein [Cyanobacteria bacterium UBA9226]
MSAVAAGVIGCFATPVKAQEALGNQIVQFSVDTIVEFEFLQSHGSYQATLGIKNETTGEETVLFREIKPYDAFGNGQNQPSSRGQDNLGTRVDYVGTVAGGTVANRLTEFTFKANNKYVFYLESVSPSGQTRRSVLSTQRFAKFLGSLDGGISGDVKGNRISWEDGGQVEVGNDSDYDDFVIEAGGYLINVTCPF